MAKRKRIVSLDGTNDPFVHLNWDLWPHTVIGVEGLQVTDDPAEVTCGSCVYAMGHQKYEPPRLVTEDQQ